MLFSSPVRQPILQCVITACRFRNDPGGASRPACARTSRVCSPTRLFTRQRVSPVTGSKSYVIRSGSSLYCIRNVYPALCTPPPIIRSKEITCRWTSSRESAGNSLGRILFLLDPQPRPRVVDLPDEKRRMVKAANVDRGDKVDVRSN